MVLNAGAKCSGWGSLVKWWIVGSLDVCFFLSNVVSSFHLFLPHLQILCAVCTVLTHPLLAVLDAEAVSLVRWWIVGSLDAYFLLKLVVQCIFFFTFSSYVSRTLVHFVLTRVPFLWVLDAGGVGSLLKWWIVGSLDAPQPR